MTGQLHGKTALITGASRGIGKETALALARQGAELILVARNEQSLRQTEEQIEQTGGSAVIVPVDLQNADEILQMCRWIQNEIGKLDILVNNAGMTLSASLEQTRTDQWEQVMAINARAPFLLCRELMPLLRKSEQGKIINVSSVVGVKGYAQQIAYTASKHALRGMSIAMAEELRDTSIRVHVLCPGGVDTDMVSAVRPDIPKEALMAPQEIAELILYLCTHKGNAVIDELHIRRAASGPWFG